MNVNCYEITIPSVLCRGTNECGMREVGTVLYTLGGKKPAVWMAQTYRCMDHPLGRILGSNGYTVVYMSIMGSWTDSMEGASNVISTYNK